MYICLLGFDQVEATFEFFDPSLQDVPAINRFLQGWLGNNQLVNTCSLAQMIAEQQTVGTIIRLGEDCVGFITCLPAQVVGKTIEKLFDVLLQVSNKTNQHSLVEKYCLLNTSQLGILISERVSNLPPQLSPWLQQAIFDEIEWATQDEPTKDRRQMFMFEHFLYITQVFVDKSYKLSSKRKRKWKEQEHSTIETDNFYFIKAEDEGYYRYALCCLTWPMMTNLNSIQQDSLEKRTMAIILNKQQVKEAINYTKTQINC
eukprot:jgi/Galph1/4042/GphlegSOOS_G2694.1